MINNIKKMWKTMTKNSLVKSIMILIWGILVGIFAITDGKSIFMLALGIAVIILSLIEFVIDVYNDKKVDENFTFWIDALEKEQQKFEDMKKQAEDVGNITVEIELKDKLEEDEKAENN